jgi:hypothetical protein
LLKFGAGEAPLFFQKNQNFNQHLIPLLRLPFKRRFFVLRSAVRKKSAGLAADTEVGGYILAEEKNVVVSAPVANQSLMNRF